MWSRDEHDPAGPVGLKVVEEVFARFAGVLRLTVAGVEIGTTAEHPFWVAGRGWVAAGGLRAGDRLVGRGGAEVAVEAVEDRGEWVRVYNFRVADHHTYFVGCPEWGFDVWTHNYNITPRINGNPVTMAQRWVDLANQSAWKLPKQVIAFIRRHGGEGVYSRFGLELAHPPGRPAIRGFDYAEALPKYAADHRGIQHRYLRERATGTTIGIPRSGRLGRGPLSLPPRGALP